MSKPLPYCAKRERTVHLLKREMILVAAHAARVIKRVGFEQRVLAIHNEEEMEDCIHGCGLREEYFAGYQKMNVSGITALLFLPMEELAKPYA